MLILLLLTVSSPAGSAVATEGGGRATLAEESDEVCKDCSLTVRTSPLERIFCPTDAETANMRWRLRLHFVNTGKQPIILYRDSGGAPVVSVSKNLEDARKGIEESRIRSLIFSLGEFEGELEQSGNLKESWNSISSP